MPTFGSPINTKGIPVQGLTAEQGTAFPSDPWEGRLFHRTDLKKFYIYLNGTWIDSTARAISDITGLQTALDGKSNTGHGHVIADISGLQAVLDGKATPAQVTTTVNSTISAVIGGAPAALDALNELAAALGNDPNFATTITNALAGKAPTVHTHTTAQVTGLDTALAGKAGFQANVACPALPAGAWTTIGSYLRRGQVEFLDVAANEGIIFDHRWTFTNPGFSLDVRPGTAWAANAITAFVIA